MDTFTKAYITCALWSSTDDRDVPLEDNYSINDFSSFSINQIEDDCTDFQRANATLISEAHTIQPDYDDGMAGHDFWLTRNRHGAGFWDRGLGEVGKELSQEAIVYGESNLYVAYGQIHVT